MVNGTILYFQNMHHIVHVNFLQPLKHECLGLKLYLPYHNISFLNGFKKISFNRNKLRGIPVVPDNITFFNH